MPPYAGPGHPEEPEPRPSDTELWDCSSLWGWRDPLLEAPEW